MKISFSFALIFITGFSLSGQIKSETPVHKYVNTLFGAAYTHHGNTIVGPQTPWGACNPGPDCAPRQWMTDGYDVDLPIKGFSQLHTNGAGGPGHYGNFLFSPQIGINIDSEGHYSDKEDEVTKCGYYAVTLKKYDIRTEITSANNSCIYLLTYPKSNDASLVIDMSHSVPGNVTRGGGYMVEGELTIIPGERRIQGWGRYIGGWCSAPYTAYFTAEFSKNFKSWGVWKNDKMEQKASTIKITEDIPLMVYNEQTKQMEWNPDYILPDRIGGYLTFNTKENEEIFVKVGVSLNSIEMAEKLLASEIKEWEFEKIRKDHEDLWEKKLNKITISLGDNYKGINNANDYEVFYTALYHTMLMPRNRSMDAPVGWDKNVPFYDDFSALWDTYRTLFPLMTLIDPELQAGVINYFIQLFKKNGFTSDGVQSQKIRIYSIGAPNKPFRYRWNQGGDAIDNIVGDAFVKKLPGVNWEDAYAMIKNNADHLRADTYVENDRGWIPEEGGKVSINYEGIEHVAPIFCNVSQALEMNLNDYCVAEVAKGLSYEEDYKKYLTRSGKWIETWNPEVTLRDYIERGEIKNAFGSARNLRDQADESIWDYKGWFGSKTLDGKFAGPGEYHESPLTDYAFFVPHDMPKLIWAMGGKDNFMERLDKTKIASWNEPGFLALRGYYFVGRPDKAMPQIRETMKLWTQMGGVKYPGDEDSGAMSSWFIWSALGFFPNAGMDYYFINGTLYPEATIRLGNGNTLVIKGKNASWENCYIQSMTVNGKSYAKSWISHEDLMKGGTIEFVMGNKPSNWGIGCEIKGDEKVPLPDLTDVSYGSHPKQILHFWKSNSEKPAPLLFFIHGGGWIGGTPMSGLGELLKPMLDAGISVVTIEYRFIGDAIRDGVYPPVKAPLMDAARALQFVRSKAREWNIDKEKIIASGGSAGACSSLWLAFHDDLADPASQDPISRESTRLYGAAVTNAQTTLDPKQMRKWIPNSVYGSHTFGIFKSVDGQAFFPEGKFAMDFDTFLANRKELLPLINEYSPYALTSRDDPPVYLYFNKEAPDPRKPQQDPTHSANFGVLLEKRLKKLGVGYELVYPGANNIEHENVASYIISAFRE